jgi:flagellar protein FliJ
MTRASRISSGPRRTERAVKGQFAFGQLRNTAWRAKGFEVTEKARKAASLEKTVIDFEHLALDLARQIAAEEERTGVKDPAHVAYSIFAMAAALRRTNLLNSMAGLRENLDAAKRDLEEAEVELRAFEPVAEREANRQLRTQEPAGWVVRVITPETLSGDAPAPEIWDVAISDPNESVKEVSKRIRAINERVEAVEELSADAIKGFGLTLGQAKQRL